MIKTINGKNPTETFKEYEVTLRFKHPAWDEKDGISYPIRAKSKSAAIRAARRQAYDDGHTVGRPLTEYTFTAEVLS